MLNEINNIVVALINASEATDAAYCIINGLSKKAKTINFPNGIYFIE